MRQLKFLIKSLLFPAVLLLFTAVAMSAEHLYCPDFSGYPHLSLGIPSRADQVIKRDGFALGYSEQYRQALWVSYLFNEKDLSVKRSRRSVSFRSDPNIKNAPVKPKDYKKSGYDRGHLAPAADMSYSQDVLQHSFFMSNISPQVPGCNRGIWKRLEKQVRKWVRQEKTLYVITGPVFEKNYKTLPGTDIPVPQAFFKVVMDLTPPVKMIAFVIPNDSSRRRVKGFATTVRDLEWLTGYDFFSELPDDVEEVLEIEADFSEWN